MLTTAQGDSRRLATKSETGIPGFVRGIDVGFSSLPLEEKETILHSRHMAIR